MVNTLESMHAPLTAKQPAVMFQPLAAVEVAVVEVEVKYDETISPTTESLAYGDVVPMPTLPELAL